MKSFTARQMFHVLRLWDKLIYPGGQRGAASKPCFDAYQSDYLAAFTTFFLYSGVMSEASGELFRHGSHAISRYITIWVACQKSVFKEGATQPKKYVPLLQETQFFQIRKWWDWSLFGQPPWCPTKKRCVGYPSILLFGMAMTQVFAVYDSF